MKRFIFLSLLFVLSLSACGTASPVAPTAMPTAAPLPVLQVDSQHMLTPNLAYEIPAGEGFVLDASNYDFGIPGGPTAVEVVIGGLGYQSVWASGATSQTVLATGLTPLSGAAPSQKGFFTGQQLLLSVCPEFCVF